MPAEWPLPPDYDPALTISLLRSKATGLLYEYGGLTISRALPHRDGAAVLLQAAFGAGQVTVTVQGQDGTLVADPALLPRVRAMLALDEPVAEANEALAADPTIADLVRRSRGKRIIHYPDLYECLVSTILGQQLSPLATQAIRRRFLDRFGRPAVFGEEEYLLFPSPDDLGRTPVEHLAEAGISRAKAAYLRAVAQAAAAGNLEIAAFEHLDDAAVTEALTGIHGVGRWSAEVALMWGLGRPDVFPSGAPALRDVVGRLAGRTARPAEEEVRAIAERWRPWRSYAALYLWQSVD